MSGSTRSSFHFCNYLVSKTKRKAGNLPMHGAQSRGWAFRQAAAGQAGLHATLGLLASADLPGILSGAAWPSEHRSDAQRELWVVRPLDLLWTEPRVASRATAVA